MKTLKLSIYLLVAVLLASCSKSDYVNVIPKESSLVTSVHLGNIATKGELENSMLKSTIQQYIGLLARGNDGKELKSIIDTPEKMGIDFRDPAYIFVSGSYIGVTMKVQKEDTLIDFFKLLSKLNMGTKPTEKDDMRMGTILDEIAYGFDSNKLLLLVNSDGGSATATKKVVNQLMKQDTDNSFVATEHFCKLTEGDSKEIRMYSTLQALPKSFSEYMKSLLPNGVNASDVEMTASVDFADGKAVLSAQIAGRTDKACQLIDDANKHFHKIEGRYIDTPAENTLAWICVGADGQWILDNLKRDEQIKQALFLVERGIDIEMMLKSVDGDMAITIPMTQSSSDSIPQFMLTAKVGNKDFMKDVDYWKSSMKQYGMTMTETSKNNYRLTAEGKEFFWGVDGDDIYFASPQAFTGNAFAKRSALLMPYTDEIRQNNIFAYIDLTNILKGYRSIPVLGAKVGKLKAIKFYSHSADNIKLEIELVDKEENFLKELF